MFVGIDSKGNKIGIKDIKESEIYRCPLCKAKLVKKLGEINVHHFAHEKGSACEHWNNDMSEWHILWQNSFPIENQEVVLSFEGKKNISDVCLSNVAIEFQHSPIQKDMLLKRSEYYLKNKQHLIWVFDCFGKNIGCNDYSSNNAYYTERQIRFNTELPTFKEMDMYWKHYKKTLNCLIGLNNIDIYLHVNEKYIIKITECSFYLGSFKGYALTVEDFIDYVVNKFNDNEIVVNTSSFKGYGDKFLRKFNVDHFKKWYRETKRKTSKKMNKVYSRYINGEIDYNTMLDLNNINYIEPSSLNSYFYDTPSFLR